MIVASQFKWHKTILTDTVLYLIVAFFYIVHIYVNSISRHNKFLPLLFNIAFPIGTRIVAISTAAKWQINIIIICCKYSILLVPGLFNALIPIMCAIYMHLYRHEKILPGMTVCVFRQTVYSPLTQIVSSKGTFGNNTNYNPILPSSTVHFDFVLTNKCKFLLLLLESIVYFWVLPLSLYFSSEWERKCG